MLLYIEDICYHARYLKIACIRDNDKYFCNICMASKSITAILLISAIVD